MLTTKNGLENGNVEKVASILSKKEKSTRSDIMM
jgi:hypothetical protein